MNQITENLLELLKSHRVKSEVQSLLEKSDAHYSGTWDKVEERVFQAIEEGKLSRNDLFRLLDRVEAYGNQHVFLYRASGSVVDQLRDEAYVRNCLSELEMEEVLDRPRLLIHPDEPSVSSVTLNKNELILKWVEKREWVELIEKEEVQDSGKGESGQDIAISIMGYVIKRYARKTSRAAVHVHVHFPTGNVDVKIQTLRSGSKYEDELEKYRVLVAPFFDLSACAEIPLRKAIQELISSDEVRHRRGKFTTARGGVVDLTSCSRDDDFTDEEFYQAGKQAVGKKLVGNYANVYWLPADGNPLQREIHSHVYKGNEIRFPRSGLKRVEVEYVLQRVRALAT